MTCFTCGRSIRRIFGDIYHWAGQIRTVVIAKESLVCLPRYIEPSAAGGTGRGGSARRTLLRDLGRDEFLERAT